VQVAEAASDTQQTEPEPQPAGGSTKKDKERQRKERQRQRKIEEASEALDRAMALLAKTGGSVEAVEEAMQAAEKHEGRSEPLAALVAEAKGMVEQARAAEAERAKVAAEEAAVKAAVKAGAEVAEAAERLQMEKELAALALSMQSDTLRMQQMQARLSVPLAAPAPQAEEELCVMCLDARKDHIILPCGH
jgi:colicin import membrane protein